ncbi:MAG: HAD family phosphatase, partial [Anaerolineae bacterium]|nr:HAD family phosphatase [Anaerolineae bacterium]
MAGKDEPWAVIWDMDGVLVDSGEAHYAAWARLFREEGIPYSREQFLQTFGQRNDRILRTLLGPDLPEERLRDLDARKEAYYRELIPSRVRLLPGAWELLHALREAGARQAVGSSGPRANVEATVAALGLQPFFGALVAAEDVAEGKPAPDVFLLAAERLEVPAAQCVVLEDAMAGVEAALAAGMRCVAVATTRPAEELRAAHRVVASLKELQAEDLRRMALCL